MNFLFFQANCVLEMLEKVAPEKVSAIILQSNCFKDYKKDKVGNFRSLRIHCENILVLCMVTY